MQLKCHICGKTVSNDIPKDGFFMAKGFIFRGLAICPECWEEQKCRRVHEQEDEKAEKYIIKDAEKKIDNILNNFDFDKVHNYMVENNWRWATEFGELIVPSIERLKHRARQILEEVANKEREVTFIATGGFKAIKLYGTLTLDFVIADWYEENEESE